MVAATGAQVAIQKLVRTMEESLGTEQIGMLYSIPFLSEEFSCQERKQGSKKEMREEGERKRGKKERHGRSSEQEHSREMGRERKKYWKVPSSESTLTFFPSNCYICQVSQLWMPYAWYCRACTLMMFRQTYPKSMIDLSVWEFIFWKRNIKLSFNLTCDILFPEPQISARDEGLLPGNLRDCLETWGGWE